MQAQTGIGTATPTSTLQVVGSLAGNYATVTAATYALGISDYYVSLGTGATAASTFTLPMAALAKGRIYYLKNDNATYAITVSPNGSETIDGSATLTVPAGQTVQLVSTGSASGATWEVVGFASSTATAIVAPTASNGLTKTGPNTALGGPLTQATNIALGSNSLTLSTGTTGTGVLFFDGQGIAGSTTNTAKQRIEFTSNGDPNAVIGHTVAAGTNENNDLYLYTGNDANGSYGPDRIRLVGENLLFQSFNNVNTSTVANAESNTNTITNMFIGSDGKVGIGTSLPTANLDVLGSVRLEALSVAGGVVTTDASGNLSSVAATTINPTTASNGLTKTGANTVLGGPLTQATNIALGSNSLTFSTGTTGTGVLVFDGQGIAGSTTNTAKQRIEFTSNGDPNAVIGHTVAAGTVENNDLFLYAGNDANGSYGPDRIRLVGENILFQSFNNVNTSTVANAESNTSTVTNMLIGSDGKVGIGTITPAASLDVNGVAIVRNGLQVTSSTGPLVSITTTTAAVGSVPAYNNVVYDVAGDENHIFGGNVVSYSDNKYSLGLSQSRWTAVYAVNGTIQTSDRRLKTNILNSAYGLGAVMKMRPVTYNWKTSPTSNPMVGFIAQEMEAIVPEAVDVPKTATEHYGMKYNELIPVLTKAIQEQQAQIEQLTAANAGLKAELAGKASTSILTELQAALQSLRAEVQGLQAASQIASSSIPR